MAIQSSTFTNFPSHEFLHSQIRQLAIELQVAILTKVIGIIDEQHRGRWKVPVLVGKEVFVRLANVIDLEHGDYVEFSINDGLFEEGFDEDGGVETREEVLVVKPPLHHVLRAELAEVL